MLTPLDSASKRSTITFSVRAITGETHEITLPSTVRHYPQTVSLKIIYILSTYTLCGSPQTTILELKEFLEPRLDCPPQRQRLLYSGRELPGNKTLAECHIEKGHVVHHVPMNGPSSSNKQQPSQLTGHPSPSFSADSHRMSGIVRGFLNQNAGSFPTGSTVPSPTGTSSSLTIPHKPGNESLGGVLGSAFFPPPELNGLEFPPKFSRDIRPLADQSKRAALAYMLQHFGLPADRVPRALNMSHRFVNAALSNTIPYAFCFSALEEMMGDVSGMVHGEQGRQRQTLADWLARIVHDNIMIYARCHLNYLENWGESFSILLPQITSLFGISVLHTRPDLMNLCGPLPAQKPQFPSSLESKLRLVLSEFGFPEHRHDEIVSFAEGLGFMCCVLHSNMFEHMCAVTKMLPDIYTVLKIEQSQHVHTHIHSVHVDDFTIEDVRRKFTGVCEEEVSDVLTHTKQYIDSAWENELTTFISDASIYDPVFQSQHAEEHGTHTSNTAQPAVTVGSKYPTPDGGARKNTPSSAKVSAKLPMLPERRKGVVTKGLNLPARDKAGPSKKPSSSDFRSLAPPEVTTVAAAPRTSHGGGSSSGLAALMQGMMGNPAIMDMAKSPAMQQMAENLLGGGGERGGGLDLGSLMGGLLGGSGSSARSQKRGIVSLDEALNAVELTESERESWKTLIRLDEGYLSEVNEPLSEAYLETAPKKESHLSFF